MSRAFVSENDGWYRCAKHREHCMMADEKGHCLLDHCLHYQEKDRKEENKFPEQNK